MTETVVTEDGKRIKVIRVSPIDRDSAGRDVFAAEIFAEIEHLHFAGSSEPLRYYLGDVLWLESIDTTSEAMNEVLEDQGMQRYGDGEIRLWIDDERPMRPPFTCHAKTVSEALAALRTGRVVEVAFDNDLGPEEAGEGYQVAQWIEEKAFLGEIGPMKWSIHSGNCARWKEIECAMTNAERFWRERSSRDQEDP